MNDERIKHKATNDPRDAFYGVWNSIYGSGSWEANPWVWVIDFEVA